jgi:hypothetical protein
MEAMRQQARHSSYWTKVWTDTKVWIDIGCQVAHPPGTLMRLTLDRDS